MKGMNMHVEYAGLTHLDGIMEIEAETFGALGEEATASRALMADRIDRCNIRGAGWFLVALHEDVVMAYLVLQPTSLGADECVSWDVSTDCGTFARTYDEDGETIFGVSLGARRAALPGAASLLCYQMIILLLKRNRKRVIFCSRIPSLGNAVVKKGVNPEAYCFQVDAQGNPLDGLLREFYEIFGVTPRRFLPNGFPPDAHSLGHSALMVVDDPVRALEISLLHMYQCGVSVGKMLRREKRS